MLGYALLGVCVGIMLVILGWCKHQSQRGGEIDCTVGEDKKPFTWDESPDIAQEDVYRSALGRLLPEKTGFICHSKRKHKTTAPHLPRSKKE